ncbi:MAG: hypothetical protein JWR83_2733 [Aeromicrobium sp.]|nr:hypothetical protein [Aeromicrobium sp.]
MPLPTVAHDELDVTERVRAAPTAVTQDRYHDQLTAEPQVILRASVAPGAASSWRPTHRLIAVIIGVALAALVGLAFAIGFIVGERQDSVPQGGPLAGSATTAAARTVETISRVQQ